MNFGGIPTQLLNLSVVWREPYHGFQACGPLAPLELPMIPGITFSAQPTHAKHHIVDCLAQHTVSGDRAEDEDIYVVTFDIDHCSPAQYISRRRS